MENDVLAKGCYRRLKISASNAAARVRLLVLMAGAEIRMKVSSLALLFRPLRCSAVAMFGISTAIFRRRTTVEGS